MTLIIYYIIYILDDSNTFDPMGAFLRHDHFITKVPKVTLFMQ